MLTLFCFYALAGLTWAAATGRIANAEHAWVDLRPPVWVKVVALIVVVLIWPVGVWRRG